MMRRTMALGLLALMGSCSNPLCGCSPPPEIAVVLGALRDGSSAPVAGYRVRAEQAAESCTVYQSTGSAGITNAAGEFDLRIYGFSDSLCLRFFAVDTTAGSVEVALTETLRVRPRPAPYDTVAAVFTLPPP